ncbi:MAG: hypothetical protein J6A75_11620 [Lachnospiraceae bacterium]|nr:hypothetical protein [Lachnospiraceae bacterium]
MATVYVEWNRLRNQGNALAANEKSLSLYAAKVNSVNAQLRYKTNYSGVTKALGNIASGIQRQAGIMQKMVIQLESISGAYKTAEGEITAQKPVVVTAIKASSINVSGIKSKEISTTKWSKNNEKFDWKLGSLLWKSIGKFGAAGNIVAAFGEMMTEGINAKTVISGSSKVLNIVGEVAKNADSKKPNYMEVLFGKWEKGGALKSVQDFAKNSGQTITTKWGVFGTSLKKQISEFLPSSCKTVGDKVKICTKWGGVILSGVTNAISNKKEMETEGISTKRAVAETITETAVDVGIGMVATAAATALLGATAPAVMVGAAAAGAVWAADAATRYLTKKITGSEKKLTELVSDTILDAAEAVEKIKNNAKKAVGNAVKNVGKAFAKWCFA